MTIDAYNLFCDAICRNPGDADLRGLFADMLEEAGDLRHKSLRAGWFPGFGGDDGFGCSISDGGGGGGDGFGFGGDGGSGGFGGGGDGGFGGGGDGGSGSDDDGDGGGNGFGGGGFRGDGGDGGFGGDGFRGDGGDIPFHETGSTMKTGLGIASISTGYYPYVLVGWCRQVEGFEWEMLGARIIRRFGSNAQLAVISRNGPQADTQLLSPTTERIFRPSVARFLECDEKAWAKECPRPTGWEDTP